MKHNRFNTRLLHSNFIKQDIHNALQMPMYSNSAFYFNSAEDIEGAFKGTKPAHAYSRSSNPTVEHFEHRIKSVTESMAVAAFASGMAAITGLMFSLLKAGDNIITTKKIFGNTYSLFENNLRPFGIEFRYVDFLNPASIASLIDENTRMVFFETINNPQLEVIDIEAVSNITRAHKILLCADTTLTPPNIFDAGKAGIDISIFSTTKYVSSGGASIGGVLVDHGSFDWANNPKIAPFTEQLGKMAFVTKLKKEVYRNTGACLSPYNAYIQGLGLETMSLRVNKMSENAMALATWMVTNPKIKAVNYPALPGSAFESVCKKQFSGLPGGLMTFDLSSKEECFKFQNRLNLIKRATNLNDNKSLIIHPASTIFCEFNPAVMAEIDIRDTMLRLSVGIEDVEDLIEDIDQAMA